MKKLMIIALALVTAVGFSQERERTQEMREKMKQERQSMTSEQRAEIHTKRLTNQLQLNESQQKQVLELHLERANNFAEKRGEMRKKAEEAGKANRLDAKKRHSTYNEKMKAILTESQYNTWKENKRKGMKNRGKHKNKQ